MVAACHGVSGEIRHVTPFARFCVPLPHGNVHPDTTPVSLVNSSLSMQSNSMGAIDGRINLQIPFQHCPVSATCGPPSTLCVHSRTQGLPSFTTLLSLSWQKNSQLRRGKNMFLTLNSSRVQAGKGGKLSLSAVGTYLRSTGSVVSNVLLSHRPSIQTPSFKLAV